MHKSISYLLVFGVLGCGNGAPSTQEVQTTPPDAASQVSSPDSAPAIVAERTLKLAQEAMQKQDYKTAIRLLNQAVQAQPELVEAYSIRATLLAEAKMYNQAIRDMDKAIRLKPEVAEYYNTRGYLYLLQENNGPAMEDFNHAIALDPNYPQPLNNRGLVRISLGSQLKQAGDYEQASVEFRKAVAELDAALRIDGKYVDAHNNRGFALSLAKQYDEAVRSFSRAIELNPKYVNAWNNRGQAYAQTGQHDLAIADFTRAIELQPDTLEYFQLRADAYLAGGKADLARKDLDYVEFSYELDAINRRLARAPKNPLHWVDRGHLLKKVARWDEAVKNYRDALQLDPNCQSALIGEADVLFHQGEFDAALAICQKVLDAGPNREAASIRGDILNQEGKYDEAIADYETAQRFDPQVAQAYLKRAEQRKTRGEIQQASADIVQAIEIDPTLRKSIPDAPQTSDQVKPGAFPVEEIEAKPIEPAAATDSTPPQQTAEKPTETPAASLPESEKLATPPTPAAPASEAAVSPPATTTP